MRAYLVPILWLVFLLEPHVYGRQITQADGLQRQIDSVIQRSGTDDEVRGAQGFDRKLLENLKRHRDVALATTPLASEYGLTVRHAERLGQLWIEWLDLTNTYGIDDEQKEPRRAALSARFIELATETRHPLFLVAMAARAMTFITRCELDEFKALLGGAAQPLAVGWAAVSGTYCDNWILEFAERHPGNAAALWKITDEIELRRADQLALLEYLVSLEPDIVTTNRTTFRERVGHHYVSLLFDAGLVEEALRVIQEFSPGERERLLKRQFDDVPITVAGLSIPTEDSYAVNPEADLDFLAALVVTGQTEDAKPRLPLVHTYSEAQAAMKCYLVHTSERPPECKEIHAFEHKKVLLLDHVLNRPGEDPYDVIELVFSSDFDLYSVRQSALWARLMRDVFDEPAYRRLVRDDAAKWRPDVYLRTEESVRHAAVNLLEDGIGPGFQERAAYFRNRLAQSVARLGGDTSQALPQDAGTQVEPAPPRFTAKQLSADLVRSRRDRDVPEAVADMVTLPDGFSLVRVERRGERAIAISASQNYDLTGEVSRGGYWVHVSNDAGKSWQPPLYTGLAELFPYVVLPESSLPLFSGDTLEIEVEVRELDQRSITYPPVGLASKRVERDLYLEIPLEELSRDTDADGFTDILEERVLLNPRDSDSDGDGLLDGRDPMPNVSGQRPPRATDVPVNLVLQRIFADSFGAIIMGTDGFSMNFAEPVSRNRPIMVGGEPGDFAGLRPSRMMFVFTRADLARLAPTRPAFHPVELTPLVLNRTGDKGFIVWNATWVGGAFRVVRWLDSWRLDPISEWIT
jgi:hypothetical protein